MHLSAIYVLSLAIVSALNACSIGETFRNACLNRLCTVFGYFVY